MNWIVPFVLGVFIGQEIENAPKVKPLMEYCIHKAFEFSKQVETETKKREPEKENFLQKYVSFSKKDD